MRFSRRHFLATGAALPLLRAAPSSRAGQAWYQKIRRCGQVDFSEKDGRPDIAQSIDDWTSLKVGALVLDAGGVRAFYPTRIPYHPRSQSLGDADLFGDFAKAARERGIRVVARLDCNWAHEEALKAHPEWFLRAADGQAVKHPESPSLYQTCMFSPYFTEQMPAIIREVNSLYNVDGFFTNGWPGGLLPPECHCEACKRRAPRHTPAFAEQHLARVLEVWKLWDAAAREKKLDSVYVGSLGGGIRATTDLRRIAQVAGWIHVDHEGRSSTTPAWDCAQQGRVAQSVMKGRPITNFTGGYSKSPAEAAMRMAQTTAGGMVPWHRWPGGTAEDQRTRGGRDFFQWIAKWEPHFVNRRPLASVAVVFSQRMNTLYTPPGGGSPAGFLQGTYLALLEGRFFFDLVHEDDLDAKSLKKYSGVILPNIALLSDAQCTQLRAYAREGGCLVGSFETARYDLAGARRKELGLADIFGASVAGEIEGANGNSHSARIEQRHAIFAGFEGTAVLPGAEYRLPVKTRLPQPLVYTRTPEMEDPAIVILEEGMSRRVWLPGDVERSYWKSGNGDLSRLLQQAIRWVSRDRSPVHVTGEGLVELFGWETEPGYAIHILNYMNPNVARDGLHETSPLGAQTVRMELPDYVKVRKVTALRSGAELRHKVSGQTLEFTLPSVADYEIAAVTKA
jgi:hypothetical protein